VLPKSPSADEDGAEGTSALPALSLGLRCDRGLPSWPWPTEDGADGYFLDSAAGASSVCGSTQPGAACVASPPWGLASVSPRVLALQPSPLPGRAPAPLRLAAVVWLGPGSRRYGQPLDLEVTCRAGGTYLPVTAHPVAVPAEAGSSQPYLARCAVTGDAPQPRLDVLVSAAHASAAALEVPEADSKPAAPEDSVAAAALQAVALFVRGCPAAGRAADVPGPGAGVAFQPLVLELPHLPSAPGLLLLDVRLRLGSHHLQPTALPAQAAEPGPSQVYLLGASGPAMEAAAVRPAPQEPPLARTVVLSRTPGHTLVHTQPSVPGPSRPVPLVAVSCNAVADELQEAVELGLERASAAEAGLELEADGAALRRQDMSEAAEAAASSACSPSRAPLDSCVDDWLLDLGLYISRAVEAAAAPAPAVLLPVGQAQACGHEAGRAGGGAQLPVGCVAVALGSRLDARLAALGQHLLGYALRCGWSATATALRVGRALGAGFLPLMDVAGMRLMPAPKRPCCARSAAGRDGGLGRRPAAAAAASRGTLGHLCASTGSSRVGCLGTAGHSWRGH
jgi:hypothetical protein